MAGLEPLVPLIYHEKQRQDSMLCAQHALNSLLQGNYFSAPDLSEIAKNLDDLEERYDDEQQGGTSNNMDDTGFFSVQVLENALEVWGLSLLRWRGEAMRPYQDAPHKQLAFILNQQQHWYTLRRFGPALPSHELDPGDGHWFNLNSTIPVPEWVGKLYLHMFLAQAEEDGYSVFVVVQTDPEAPLAIPRTDADDVAATLPEPSGGTRMDGAQPGGSGHNDDMMGFQGLEDEDMELQMILQASLGQGRVSPPPTNPPQLLRTSIPLPAVDSNPSSEPGSGTRTPSQYSTPVHSPSTQDDPNLDPVAAHMEHSRRILANVLAEQHQAQRELEAEGGNHRRRQELVEEEEELRRAIAESEAMARTEGHGRPDDDEPVRMDVDAARSSQSFPGSAGAQHHVYDDDDQELQAAIKASMAQIPEGWTPPTFDSPAPAPPAPMASSSSRRVPSASEPTNPVDDDEGSIASEDTNAMESSDAAEAPAEEVSVEEMRRRRLARFGM